MVRNSKERIQMDKREEDEIFSEYLYIKFGKARIDDLEQYEPLRETFDFKSYELNVLWNKLINEIVFSIKRIVTRVFRRKE